MATPRLVEDYHGRYWVGGRNPNPHTENGFRFLNTYGARCNCTNDGCFGGYLITRRADGWWWAHETFDQTYAEGGPYDEWQTAASAAVDAGARPVE